MKRFVIVFLLFFAACDSGLDQKPFDKLAEYFGAKVSYTTGSSVAVGKEKQNYIALNIKGSPYLNTEQPKRIAVYAAVLLYVNLSDDEINKYTDIEVSLFKNETDKEPVYNRTYSIETVKNIAAKSENFNKVAELLLNGKTNNIDDLFNKKNQAPDLKEFVDYIEELKKERSGVKAVKLLGVKSVIDDNTKERFLVFEGLIGWGNAAKTVVMIETSRDPNIEGIISLNLK